MVDLPLGDRVRCDDVDPSLWLIEAELTKLRHGSHGKRATRTVRFGSSSIACAWRDHPVEVSIAIGADTWKSHRGAQKAYGDALEELRALCNATAPSWAILTSRGRGPSMPEMRAPAPPETVELHTVFFANGEFDETAVKELGANAYTESWSSGRLLSVSKFWNAGEPDTRMFAQRAWKILTRWSRTARNEGG
jgi:hypothetical protein